MSSKTSETQLGAQTALRATTERELNWLWETADGGKQVRSELGSQADAKQYERVVMNLDAFSLSTPIQHLSECRQQAALVAKPKGRTPRI
jgi:hypothetical protein